jgi:DNA-binding NarL/FixJ family response regulator
MTRRSRNKSIDKAAQGQAMLRILIADDHAVIREALRGLLARRSDWHVCGEASTGREAVELARCLRPDIAILDLSMPELNGFEAAAQLRKALPNTEVLIFTMHETEDLVRQVIAAGARAYLLKSDAVKHIEAAVEALAQHKPYFASSVSEIMFNALKRSAADDGAIDFAREPLTGREREIVQLLAEGISNKQISGRLGMAVATVQTHRARIMRKLNVRSIAELVRYAVRNKIIEP